MNDQEIVRVVANYSLPNSSAVQNVFIYEYSGPGDDDSDVLTVLDAFFTNNWGADWADIAASDCDFDSIDVDVLNTDGTVKRNVGTAAIGVSGDLPEDAEPSAVAVLISADTALPKQRGRKYVPAISDQSIIDGLIIIGVIADIVILIVEYLAVVKSTLSGELNPGVLSTTLASFEPFVASGVITDVPAYQRRRKPGVGS